jgi:hypothetical protein
MAEIARVLKAQAGENLARMNLVLNGVTEMDTVSLITSS